jgi:hypothetical protein
MKALRKIIFILFLLSFFSIDKGYAQLDTLSSARAKRQIFLSFSAGLVQPLGEISYFDKSESSMAGYAGTGFNGKLDLIYLFSKRFGIFCSYISSFNKAENPDSSSLFSPLNNGMGGGITRISYKYDTKTWFTNEVLAGPVLVLVNNDIVTLSIKMAGGIQQVQSPKTQESDSGYAWQVNWSHFEPYLNKNYQPRMTSYNFVFDAGIDYKLKLSDKLGINFSLSYLVSHAIFRGNTSWVGDSWVGLNQTYTQSEEAYPISFAKTIYLFCFDVGVSYKLR